ncbi:molybdopterin-dependent oxidoreductase [Paracoccus contaminans]|nr:molybdopterin-dependent oxidoreductase [Paracoccus contaminans]
MLGLMGGGRTLAALAGSVTLPFANGERPLVTYPGKRAMIGLTSRPPQLETPFRVFDEGVLTPNDAFFVRYHLAGIPESIDTDAYRITVAGKVATPLSLSLKDLREGFTPVEIVAAHQCSGNSRGFVEPRVAGGQLANGAMGNARWTGVPLRAVLERAGIDPSAVEVAFGGLDGPVLEGTPDFEKSLKLDHALDGEVMLAWAMNGQDLPWLNGYPVRLVVPGYFGTYWIKHLDTITVLDKPFEGYWMTKAYRIPDNDTASVPPGTKPDKTRPIGRFVIRSFITSVVDGDQVSAGAETMLRGIAFDGGSGIARVEVSIDDGATWAEAKLGEDLGRYSFRQWTLPVTLKAGNHSLKVRATSTAGETQPTELRWNPAGYMRNVVETTRITAA